VEALLSSVMGVVASTAPVAVNDATGSTTGEPPSY
jgi:hypothetical protein